MATFTSSSILDSSGDASSSSFSGDESIGIGDFPGSGAVVSATTTAAGLINMDNPVTPNNGIGGGDGGGTAFDFATDDLFMDYGSLLTQLAAIFCVIFIIVGVPGNLITIIALARCKKVSQKLTDRSFHNRSLNPG